MQDMQHYPSRALPTTMLRSQKNRAPPRLRAHIDDHVRSFIAFPCFTFTFIPITFAPLSPPSLPCARNIRPLRLHRRRLQGSCERAALLRLVRLPVHTVLGSTGGNRGIPVNHAIASCDPARRIPDHHIPLHPTPTPAVPGLLVLVSCLSCEARDHCAKLPTHCPSCLVHLCSMAVARPLCDRSRKMYIFSCFDWQCHMRWERRAESLPRQCRCSKS